MKCALGSILGVLELVEIGLNVLSDAKALVVEDTRREGALSARAMRRVLGSILKCECLVKQRIAGM